MSRQKMLAAKELIQEQDYAAARALLRTVDHPTARDWLAKIDELAPEQTIGVPMLGARVQTPQKSKRARLVLLIVLLGVLAALLIAWRQEDLRRFARFRVFAYCLDVYNEVNDPYGGDNCSAFADEVLQHHRPQFAACDSRAGALDSSFASCMVNENILPPGVFID